MKDQPSNQSINALIIDDEQTITNLLSKYLKLKGVTCATANNETQALELCNLGNYDIIITDINLTRNGAEGINIINYIKTRPNKTIIYAMSGLTENNQAALDAGAKQVLNKPFNLKQLDDLIKNIK